MTVTPLYRLLTNPPVTPRDPIGSGHRWRRLSMLLIAVERGVVAAAQLDARSGQRLIGDGRAEWLVEERLRDLEKRIDHELDRLTIERLLFDLRHKQQQQRADLRSIA